MNTKVYEYIVAIAEERSITRAAERYYLSQPSLSRHLANIEEEMGAKLFRRRGGELALTDAGKIFINGAQAMLRIEQQAAERVEQIRRSQRRELRLVCQRSYMEALSRSVLPRLDGLQVSVLPGTAAEARAAMASGEADAVILASAGEPGEGLAGRELGRERMAVAVCAAQPEIPGAETCFFLHERAMPERELEDALLASAGIEPGLVCTVADNATAAEMTARGCGCSVMPERLIGHGGGIAAADGLPTADFPIRALYRPGGESDLARRLELFIDTAERSFRLTEE